LACLMAARTLRGSASRTMDSRFMLGSDRDAGVSGRCASGGAANAAWLTSHRSAMRVLRPIDVPAAQRLPPGKAVSRLPIANGAGRSPVDHSITSFLPGGSGRDPESRLKVEPVSKTPQPLRRRGGSWPPRCRADTPDAVGGRNNFRNIKRLAALRACRPAK
jgi:hypothetical protein